MNPSDLDLEKALALLALPRELGLHPETGERIVASEGRFGPYVQQGSLFVSLKKEDNVFTIDLHRALELIAQSGKKVITLGEYRKKPVTVQKGRFGYYIKYNKMNITLPKGTDPEAVTLEQATEILEARLDKEAADKAAGKASGKTGASGKKTQGTTAGKSAKGKKVAAKTKG